jgi:hypothetical protein
MRIMQMKKIEEISLKKLNKTKKEETINIFAKKIICFGDNR